MNRIPGKMLVTMLVAGVLTAQGAGAQTPEARVTHAVTTSQATTVAQDAIAYHSRFMYAGIKQLFASSIESMPDEHFGFRPTPEVRGYAQVIGHAIDYQYLYCSLVLGERRPPSTVEKTKSTKAELRAALADATSYCDRAYNTVTDAGGAEMVKLGTFEMPKLGLLYLNVIHSTEHYGNLVTYMRLKGIVPPSSQPGFTVAPPKR